MLLNTKSSFGWLLTNSAQCELFRSYGRAPWLRELGARTSQSLLEQCCLFGLEPHNPWKLGSNRRSRTAPRRKYQGWPFIHFQEECEAQNPEIEGLLRGAGTTRYLSPRWYCSCPRSSTQGPSSAFGDGEGHARPKNMGRTGGSLT